MSDEMGDGSFGYLNHIASYVLGDIALRTGDPVALQTARRDAAGLYGTGSGCATTERLGAWLTVRLDGGHIGPDLLDVLAPGYAHACSPVGHCDAVELVRLLAAGQRPDAAAVTARLENGADANPSFLGCAPPRCTHARSLTMIPDGPWPLSGHTAATLGRWSARRRLRMPAGCFWNGRRTKRSAIWTRRLGCSPPRAPNETRHVSAACSASCRRSRSGVPGACCLGVGYGVRPPCCRNYPPALDRTLGRGWAL